MNIIDHIKKLNVDSGNFIEPVTIEQVNYSTVNDKYRIHIYGEFIDVTFDVDK